jgi:hypothetical protein
VHVDGKRSDHHYCSANYDPNDRSHQYDLGGDHDGSPNHQHDEPG